MKAPLYKKESERLDVVHKMGILDTNPDPIFDKLTKEALERMNVPISTISIIDENREWYMSCQGIPNKQGPRDIAFCSWALISKDAFIVEDTLKDDRFKNNPYVTGEPYIRFYAGIALIDSGSGMPVGVFCVKDTKPRKLSTTELGTLFELAQKAESLINDKKFNSVVL